MEKENFQIIAKTFFGLENVLIQELKAIGAQNIEKINRAVAYTGNKEILYKSNLLLRTAIKVLMPVTSFIVKDEADLYKKLNSFEWDLYFDYRKTLSVEVQVNSEKFQNSRYITYKVKDAVVDYFREKYNRRPFINIDNPHNKINIHIFKDKVTVSLDSSGESLHKRNYRMRDGLAPVNEVLAAGMILMTGWDKKMPLIDPMCGSGTMLIEAAMIANNIPASIKRKDFCFLNWKDYDEVLWKKVQDDAVAKITEHDGYIYGSDISEKAYALTLENINNSYLGEEFNIKLSVKPLLKIAPPADKGIVIMNPPYGERIKTDQIMKLYKDIGSVLKQNFNGHDAWIISSNFSAINEIGLHSTERHILYNGKLECKYNKYEIYQGSKKVKKQFSK